MTAKPKNREGYVIAVNKLAPAYFSSSSSYDRPRWVSLTEASTYLTADMAANAVKKLWQSGSISAKVVPLSELNGLEMEMPDQTDDMTDDSSDEMVADKQAADDTDEMRGVCPECDCDPCECEDDLGGDDMPDDEMGLDGNEEFQDEEDSLLAQHLRAESGTEGEETARLHPKEVGMLGRKRLDMKEAFKMPQRPGNDPAKPTENKTTVANMTDPKSKQFDFKDPVGEEDKPETDLTHAVANQHEDKVNVPADIKAQLKSVITDLSKTAKAADGMDDNTGSFALTAAAALQQLLDDLELGTTVGIKQAQIHMTSYMSPIVNHIPADVINFIGRGGRKSSLKDLFGAKWDDKRGTK